MLEEQGQQEADERSHGDGDNRPLHEEGNLCLDAAVTICAQPESTHEASKHKKSTTIHAGATVGDQHVDQFEKATHTRCASAFRGAFRDGTPNHAAIEAPPIEL